MNDQQSIANFVCALLDAGTKGLRQIEIASPFQGYKFQHMPGMFWTSCLNTYVSNLNKHGITLARCPDPYINESGKKANYKRYWLRDRQSAKAALILLNHWRHRKHLEPIAPDLAQMLVNQFPEAEPTPKAG